MRHIGDLSIVLNRGARSLLLPAVSRKCTEVSAFLSDGLLDLPSSLVVVFSTLIRILAATR